VEAFLCDQAKALQGSDFVMTEFEEVQDNMKTFRKIPATGFQLSHASLLGCAGCCWNPDSEAKKKQKRSFAQFDCLFPHISHHRNSGSSKKT